MVTKSTMKSVPRLQQHQTGVENINQFKTRELRLAFLCVDSTGEHETGEPEEWQNTITLKYRIYNRGNQQVVELQSAPPASIRYTTDGSNPKEYGGLYDGEIIVLPGLYVCTGSGRSSRDLL